LTFSWGGTVGEGVGEGEDDGEDEALGAGDDVELAVGEGVPVGGGVLLDEGVGYGEDEALGVGVDVELPVSEELDSTYATKNTSKQAHTNKTINALLPIFHFNQNKQLIIFCQYFTIIGVASTQSQNSTSWKQTPAGPPYSSKTLLTNN
jgi:hypothetical protein